MYRVRWAASARVWALSLASVWSAGCDDGSTTGNPSPADAAADAAARADANLRPEAGPDAATDAATDGGAPDARPDATCVYPADCPEGDCVAGACLNARPVSCVDDPNVCPPGESCGGLATRSYCATPCELDRTCARRPRPCTRHAECPSEMSCHGGRCINSCSTDLGCPPGGFCSNGECIPVPPDLVGGDPPTDLTPGDGLFAGVAVAPFDYPMGVELAGYGARPGPRNPYAFDLGGSDRAFERQDVRVIVLAHGPEVLVLLRLPLSWSTDHILTLVNQKLRALTISPEHPRGLDFSGRIVTFGNHSHSQPARFWNLAPGTGFGVFGHGRFSPEMTERYTTSFATTIKAALDDLGPARAGFAVVDDFDPERRIHSDRRGANAPNVDDRLLVLRVDDAEGNPRAALVNLAIHGTHMEETWVTGDVGGAIEVVATERLSAIAGHEVPVIFANGNAGDISPRGDDVYSQSWGKIQTVGHRVWPHFEAAYSSIVTDAAPPLEVVTRRLPIDYDILGYDRTRPEFADGLGEPQVYGGFQCVVDERTWGEEPPYEEGALGCRLNIARIIGAPMRDVHKTLISAFRLGDLIVTTLPGEPTSSLGQGISNRVEQLARDAGWAAPRVLNFGYAQDHHLYLLLAEDWLQGGYEASQNLWGWRLGAYITEQSVLLASQLLTPEREDNQNNVKPTWWPDLVDDTVLPTPSVQIAAMLQEAPETVTRGALIELAWRGGHPGVDLPRFVLERQQPDTTWLPTPRAGHALPFDDRGFETQVVYRGDFADDHTWAARIELPFDLPVGTWRLRVEGHALPESARDNPFDAAPYVAEGRPFALTPARLRVHEIGFDAGVLRFAVTLPDGPSTDTGGAFERLEPTGFWARLDTTWQDRTVRDGLRRIALLIGPPLPIGAGVEVTVDAGPARRLPTEPTQITRPFVMARDAEGNETLENQPSVFASAVRVPDLAPGLRAITVSDAHGNLAQFEVEVPDP